MRIATLVVGLCLSVLLLFQSLTGGMFGDEDTAGAAGAGLIMAFLWLLGSGLVIAFPRLSAVLFGLSAYIGLRAPTGDFEDLRVHGFLAVMLATMAFFGWRGKRASESEHTAELERQRRRDLTLEEMIRQQHGESAAPAKNHVVACPLCRSLNGPTARFCNSCGASMRVPTGKLTATR